MADDDSPLAAQEHDADGQDYAGTPRPDAIVPALDQGQLEVLGEVGREWERVSAGPQVWRQALPVDPALGESGSPTGRRSGPTRKAADPASSRVRTSAGWPA